jgi:prepilin peptidase CpaA
MSTYISVWVLLLLISFYDLSENRIPNKLLVLLLIFGFFHGFHQIGIKEQALGLVLYFSSGLILYYMKVMSAGDVKLLGVMGMIFGASSIIDVGYYILIASGLIGTMYLFLFKVNTLEFQGCSLSVNPLNKQIHARYKEKITMPFAPSVVIGLAMYSYFT